MFPIWIYFAVALTIALMAFVLGQFVSGLGVAFVIGASSLWTALSISRQRRINLRQTASVPPESRGNKLA